MRDLPYRTITSSLLFTLSCGSHEPAPDVELEVYTWWRAPSEQDAFDALVDPFKREHPKTDVTRVDRADSAETSGDLAERLLACVPPNSFQANVGADLKRWAAVDFEPAPEQSTNRACAIIGDESSLLEDVGPILSESGALEQIYPEVRAGLCARVDGRDQYFGVPVNVHRINLLYFNRKLAAQEDFTSETLCPTVLEDGHPAFDIALAGDNFSLMLLMFENILLSLEDDSFYLDLFKGQPHDNWRSVVEHALGCVWYLSRSFVTGIETWDGAVSSVANGSATMMVMGDWANPEFERILDGNESDAGQAKLAATIGRMVFPGTEDYFVYSSDTFPLPLAATQHQYTEQLLRTFTRFDTQLEFSKVKGSIPALISDDPPPGLSPWALEALADFNDPDITKVLATSGWFPAYVSQSRLSEALKSVTGGGVRFSDLPNVTQPFLDLLASSLPLFESWQARLEACD